MARKTAKQEPMIIQILEIDREQLTKVGIFVWAMTGAAIGSFFILASLVVLLLPLIPGMPQYTLTGGLYIIAYSIFLTFVLTVFYGMMGGLLGLLMSHAVNWILQKTGGIKIKVQRI